HQRCPRARAGRRGGRHEQRYASGKRSRQPGRSGFEPDQADRNRRDRQAIADHARRTDHVLDRKRCRQIFRHHSGRIRLDLSGAQRAQYHASRDATQRDPLSRYFQRADHHLPDSARVERRALSRGRCRRTAAPQPTGLRHHRPDRAVRRHQDHRHDSRRTPPRLIFTGRATPHAMIMKYKYTFAILAFFIATAARAQTPNTAQEMPACAVTGNVALTSDYIFRGLTQTWDRPAVQGGTDLSLANGFATGAWASNISGHSYPGGSMELD